jgi:hypothetical protein
MDGFDRTGFDADAQDLALHLPAAHESHTKRLFFLFDAKNNI